jgi:DNA replication protein DnaC
MLTHPTLDKLQALKLTGMTAALSDQLQMPDIEELSFDERLGLLVDRELTARDNRRLTSRLRRARLKHQAALEDIDYRHPRGLDKSLIQALAACRWVQEHLNILITGPTGVGKTWLACALAQKACREGHTALYLRLPRLLQELAIAKGDGRYPKLLTTLAKTEVLILDDWGLVPLTAEQRRDLLEILEDRHGVRSTLATSQLPLDKWHDLIGDPTLADAILDRLVHNAYKITLKGASMRKRQATLTRTTPAE